MRNNQSNGITRTTKGVRVNCLLGPRKEMSLTPFVSETIAVLRLLRMLLRFFTLYRPSVGRVLLTLQNRT